MESERNYQTPRVVSSLRYTESPCRYVSTTATLPTAVLDTPVCAAAASQNCTYLFTKTHWGFWAVVAAELNRVSGQDAR